MKTMRAVILGCVVAMHGVLGVAAEQRSPCLDREQRALYLHSVGQRVELHTLARDLRTRADLPTRATSERMLCFTALARMERRARAATVARSD